MLNFNVSPIVAIMVIVYQTLSITWRQDRTQWVTFNSRGPLGRCDSSAPRFTVLRSHFSFNSRHTVIPHVYATNFTFTTVLLGVIPQLGC